jgi:hypothetical protein
MTLKATAGSAFAAKVDPSTPSTQPVRKREQLIKEPAERRFDVQDRVIVPADSQ